MSRAATIPALNTCHPFGDNREGLSWKKRRHA